MEITIHNGATDRKYDWCHVKILESDLQNTSIQFGKRFICKTQSEALEAAELLKAFFEAKHEGKRFEFIVGESTHSRSFTEGVKAALKQSKSQPSDYQIRLERYAVDMFTKGVAGNTGYAVEFAHNIIRLSAQKAREHEQGKD